jgi:hypothetical protein
MKYLVSSILLLFVISAYSQKKDDLLGSQDSLKLHNVTVWSKEDSIKYYKSPGTAMTYSLIAPGLALGQLYNGNYAGWGIRTLITGLCVGAYFLGKDTKKEIGVNVLVLLAFGGNWITSVFDAHNDANRFNLKHKYRFKNL